MSINDYFWLSILGYFWLSIYEYVSVETMTKSANMYLGCQFAPAKLVQSIPTHHLKCGWLITCFEVLVNCLVGFCWWIFFHNQIDYLFYVSVLLVA